MINKYCNILYYSYYIIVQAIFFAYIADRLKINLNQFKSRLKIKNCLKNMNLEISETH